MNYHFVNFRLQVPNGLNISGRVQCHKRMDPREYQISHKYPKNQKEIQEPNYEVELTSILSQILTEDIAKSFFEHKTEDFEKEKERRKELVSGRHIQVGNDLLPYICCPNLPEKNLKSIVKLWLTHQVLFTKTGHDIGYFECFLLSEKPTFEDWLENDNNMKNVQAKKKDWIRTDKTLFMKVKEVFEKKDNEGLIERLTNSILTVFKANITVELF